MTGRSPSPSGDDALQTIVAACIEARSHGGESGVEAVLRSHPEFAAAARVQLTQLQRAGLLDERPTRDDQSAAPVPTTIGPYRLLEPLGHGGMGTVYLAEQREGVRRRVALKLIKLGMDTREVVARFGAERQALAMMNHAHIAKVLDAGSTVEGRPYFVMEYVAGLPITEYCDRQHFGSKQRLALFLAVCDGVQHAHLKGVIHRDLKPSNVLVAEEDGVPVPKIIDFGVAKAIGPRLTDATLHTHAGVMVGTPEYMSPEQAGRDALDVDTRTDVYSLGVLLYELLTGHLPFASSRLRQSWVEMQRILREEDPRTPSQRLRSEPETAADAAARRATDVAALQRELRGDLDCICLVALAKERDRRYATVNDLAADIRRHLANEPVHASPPSRLYRLRKFVRRNRLQVAAGTAVAAALVSGLAVSLVYYGRARDAAATAQDALRGESTARASAEANFARALRAVDQLLLRVADVDLDEVPQMEGPRKALLSDALSFYQELLRERQNDPRLRFEAARTEIAIARLSNLLGDASAGRTAAREAVAILRDLLVERSDTVPIRIQLTDALTCEAEACTGLGDADAASKSYDAAILELQGTAHAQSASVSLLLPLARALQLRGIFSLPRDLRQATADFGAAVDYAKRAASVGVELAPATAARCQLSLYRALTKAGSLNEAEKELVVLRDELSAQSSGAAGQDTRETLIATLGALFPIYFARGELDQAEATARHELSLRQAMLAEQPGTPRRRADLATCHGYIGIALSRAEKTGADVQFETAIRILEQVVSEVPLAQFRAALASQCLNFAIHSYQVGTRERNELARARVERSVELSAALHAQDPTSREHAGRLVTGRALLANIMRGLGDEAAALPIAESALRDAQTLAAMSATPADLITVVDAASTAADLALERRDFERVRRHLEVGFDAARRSRTKSDDHDVSRRMQMVLQRTSGLCYALAGDHVAAAASVAELLTLGEGDRRIDVAAGDVLRLAWRTSGREADVARGYAARARMHYDEAIRRLDLELTEHPDDGVMCYYRACAQLGRAELDAKELPAGELATALREPLAVLRLEFEHSEVGTLLAAQVRDGYAARAQALLTLGDVAGARAATAELVAVSAAEPRAMLQAARLFARAAHVTATQEERDECVAASVAALRRCVDAGACDAGDIDSDPGLELVRSSAAGQALLQTLKR